LPGERNFDFLFGKKLMGEFADAVVASLGLDDWRAKANVAKLDGLLVLWRARE
jgi:hypothetical protein